MYEGLQAQVKTIRPAKCSMLFLPLNLRFIFQIRPDPNFLSDLDLDLK